MLVNTYKYYKGVLANFTLPSMVSTHQGIQFLFCIGRLRRFSNCLVVKSENSIKILNSVNSLVSTCLNAFPFLLLLHQEIKPLPIHYHRSAYRTQSHHRLLSASRQVYETKYVKSVIQEQPRLPSSCPGE